MSFNESDFWKANRLLELKQTAFEGSGAWGSCTFDRDNGLVRQMDAVRRYAGHFEQMQAQGLGLLLWGRPGGGKTFAAACLANALMERGISVRMATLGEILSRLPALSPQEKLSWLEGFKTCGLLILDDFGMERRTDYAREQTFAIIDGRYAARLPLVVTTNLTLGDLTNPPDIAAARILDRVTERCIPLAFDSGSLRPARAIENQKRCREILGI